MVPYLDVIHPRSCQKLLECLVAPPGLNVDLTHGFTTEPESQKGEGVREQPLGDASILGIPVALLGMNVDRPGKGVGIDPEKRVVSQEETTILTHFKEAQTLPTGAIPGRRVFMHWMAVSG